MPAAKDNVVLGAELDIASHGGRLLLDLLSSCADKGEEVTTGAPDVQTTPRCLAVTAKCERRVAFRRLGAPERLFDEPDELVTWARAALAAARRVAAKRKRTARRRKSKCVAE